MAGRDHRIMSEKPKQLGYRQRLELWRDKRRKKPPVFAGVSRTEIDHVEPMDFFISGAPTYPKLVGPLILGVGYIIGAEILKSPAFGLSALILNQLEALQGPVAIVVGLITVAIAILFQTGTFGRIWAQIEPLIVRDPVTDSEIETAIRISEKPICLWWPGREKAIEKEFEEWEKKAKEAAEKKKKDDAEKNPGTSPTTTTSTELPIVVLPEMPSGRLSDVNDIIAIINSYAQIKNVVVPRGEEVEEMKLRLLRICKAITLDAYVNLLPVAGGRQIIVVSHNKLFAENPTGDRKQKDGESEVIELQRHQRTQRTFTYQAKNPGAMWGTFTRMSLYTNYVIPPRWRRLFPGWNAQINLFPIYWVSASAGQCQQSEKGFTKGGMLEMKELQKVIETYNINLLPEVIDDLKIAVDQLDRKDRWFDNLLKEMDYDIKRAAYWLLSMMSRMPNAGKVGIGQSMKLLLSRNLVKLIIGVVLIIACAYVLVTVFPEFFGAGGGATP
jgi:hypothetical protein